MRAIGLALVAASAKCDGLIIDERELELVAVAGLIARQRRMLEAVYSLIDEELSLEAQIVFRSQVEFMIVQKWLIADMELHYPLWLIEDVRARLALHNEVLRVYGHRVLMPETIQLSEETRTLQSQRIAHICADRRIEVPKYPKLVDQAIAADEIGTYAMAYRYDSQAAVHPRSFAVEQLLEKVPGGIVIRSEPHQPVLDLYAGSAGALLVGLNSAQGYSPLLAIDGLELLDQEFQARKEQDYPEIPSVTEAGPAGE